MIFRRWHPQLALRYLPIVRFINKSGLKNSRILEIGSGSLGIGPYLGKPITAVDIDFSGPNWKNLKKIVSSATQLPFAHNSFDVSLSVDLLEHLPEKSRLQALTEQFRVSKNLAIIALPLGKDSSAQDQLLNQEYRNIHLRQHPFLQEHLQYGLPQSEKQLRELISRATSKKISILVQGNRNLFLRLWLMRGWTSRSKLVNLFFRKILLPFLPLLRIMDKYPPHYRQIFYVKLGKINP
jgi:predicted SAM-dependent methyltransferase